MFSGKVTAFYPMRAPGWIFCPCTKGECSNLPRYPASSSDLKRQGAFFQACSKVQNDGRGLWFRVAGPLYADDSEARSALPSR